VINHCSPNLGFKFGQWLLSPIWLWWDGFHDFVACPTCSILVDGAWWKQKVQDRMPPASNTQHQCITCVSMLSSFCCTCFLASPTTVAQIHLLWQEQLQHWSHVMVRESCNISKEPVWWPIWSDCSCTIDWQAHFATVNLIEFLLTQSSLFSARDMQFIHLGRRENQWHMCFHFGNKTFFFWIPWTQNPQRSQNETIESQTVDFNSSLCVGSNICNCQCMDGS